MPILTYKHINAHYQDTGQGTPLVLLHGFLEDLSMWDKIIASMKNQCRLITVDLLGHGKTQNLGYIHEMQDHARLVKMIIDQLNLPMIRLVGHSMGGYVALAFAEMYPEKVGGICLLNSTPLADSPEKIINRERGVKAVKENHKLFVRMAIPNLFSEKNRVLYHKEVELLIQQASLMSSQGIIASLEGMKIRKDLSFVLEQFNHTGMVILGLEDTVLDYKQQSLITKTMGIELVTCPGGHMSSIENEQQVINALKSFEANSGKEQRPAISS